MEKIVAHEQEREILLAEYEALKSEQTSRIVLRDRLMYAALAALAATLALVVQPAGHEYLLLLLPLVCVVLGWTYFVNDQKITAISRYLGGKLAPLLRVRTHRGGRVLAWESVHRGDPLRRLDKSMQLVVELLMFVAPALSSVVLYWFTDGVRSPLLVVSIAEVLVTLGFAARVVAAADLSAGEQGRH
ncbi:hypothetical protein [Amycolatopsis thailandensis]|uniref:hypothetical protein n=1 Tax=Amycolatopsis thailandensis TaxID=589330 RepID=UPI003640799A